MMHIRIGNAAGETDGLPEIFDTLFPITADHDRERLALAGEAPLGTNGRPVDLEGLITGDFKYTVSKFAITIGGHTSVTKFYAFDSGRMDHAHVKTSEGRSVLAMDSETPIRLLSTDLRWTSYRKFGIDFTGNSHANRFEGGSQRDVLAGLGGDDRLYGRGGADRLLGDAGADTLAGGLGTDRLAGGYGADRFVFRAAEHSPAGTARDVVVDFGLGADILDLGHLAAGRLEFIGRDGFGGADGEVRFAHHVVAVDLDGDTRADLEIRIKGDASLAAADFHL